MLKGSVPDSSFIQALTWASIEPQYKNINGHTVGIIFFETPHQGSEQTSYGKVLINIATTVLQKPTSRLIDALQTNSDQLLRLTSEFKFQLPKYKVASFYELKPMKHFATPVCASRNNVAVYIP